MFSKRLKVIFSIFTMSEFVGQRYAIKFCLRNGISIAETFRILQKDFGDLTMLQKNVYKWYKDFKEGRERVDDLERPGRPSTSTDTKVVDCQLKTLLTLLVFKGDHSAPFQKIFWADYSWFLHHDKASSHTALVLRDHFIKNSTHIVPQPPYSPDLTPCDFWLFPKLKRPLRGHHFDTIEEIQAESKKASKAIPEIEFNKCFDDWKNVGISALYREGITMKGMKLIWINK